MSKLPPKTKLCCGREIRLSTVIRRPFRPVVTKKRNGCCQFELPLSRGNGRALHIPLFSATRVNTPASAVIGIRSMRNFVPARYHCAPLSMVSQRYCVWTDNHRSNVLQSVSATCSQNMEFDLTRTFRTLSVWQNRKRNKLNLEAQCLAQSLTKWPPPFDNEIPLCAFTVSARSAILKDLPLAKFSATNVAEIQG